MNLEMLFFTFFILSILTPIGVFLYLLDKKGKEIMERNKPR